ncbi:MAG: tetraacyldisaccharide 4'-kinase [Flavobacteriales bacterium]|nr:tetraacyldisaccharide 4'-kinase [Flavobacteriales bacterium]MBK7239783.1 tetraacyldisaccharide 4'-kinase [Flavobacteriales bacterium]MBK9536526.1 tetraacyldisaccharide 4'-kinase [Flavobacteriales bacterium]MBP9137428.1 tetraacyldisaccharide 4'-kinase [Flavobacteriales bacterium]HQV50772.1 tetraacyldisaccharide 4'-kinase [Flavobacteriales bacterium]
MTLLRILLAPFTLLHAAVLRIRHLLYDTGVIRPVRPAIPTIAIGNLALGGTGKTPMMELVLRILKGTEQIATLSRGYGRKGSDLHEVNANDATALSGDEPVQVKRNFPQVHVFVGADRIAGIVAIQEQLPDVSAVVLDDALQHRKVNAGLNILLTTWQRPYCDDVLFPAGTLRDLRYRAEAAQVIVVTKCPSLPSDTEQDKWRHRLRIDAHQQLFFSGIEYESLRPYSDPVAVKGEKPKILLFTGIADPRPLLLHVRSLADSVEHIAFKDHHAFTSKDLHHLATVFGKFAPGPKMLVTTEKDAARLGSVIRGSALEGLPLYVIGMRAVILNEPERFAELIQRHVATHKTHS